MQMCEGSGGDVSGTEHPLLIGKHARLQRARTSEGGASRPGRSPPARGLSAPWEPEPALHRQDPPQGRAQAAR